MYGSPPSCRCELRSQYSFIEFQERRQIIGRNPKMGILDNKLKLRTTLQAYVAMVTVL